MKLSTLFRAYEALLMHLETCVEQRVDGEEGRTGIHFIATDQDPLALLWQRRDRQFRMVRAELLRKIELIEGHPIGWHKQRFVWVHRQQGGIHMLARTPEELAAMKAKLAAEYKALPDVSYDGNDNRAAEKLVLKTFERIEAGENIFDMFDEMYNLMDDLAQEHAASEVITVLHWAEGEKGEL